MIHIIAAALSLHLLISVSTASHHRPQAWQDHPSPVIAHKVLVDMDFSLKDAAIVAIIIESILYGQYLHRVDPVHC